MFAFTCLQEEIIDQVKSVEYPDADFIKRTKEYQRVVSSTIVQ